MSIDVINAKFLDDYNVHIEFADGAEGVVDIRSEFGNDHRQIVRDVLDSAIFKTMKVDLGTLRWANEVDFCPDYLYKLISGKKTLQEDYTSN